MSFTQRLACFISCIRPWLSTIVKSLAWCLIALCLVSGQPVIAISTPRNLRRLLLNHLLFGLFNRLYEYTSSLRYGYRHYRRRYEANIWLTPYLTKAVVLELISIVLGGSRLGFISSGSRKSPTKRSDTTSKSNLIGRASILYQRLGIFYFSFLPLLFFIIYLNICKSVDFTRTLPPSFATSVWCTLITTCFFPGIGLEQVPAFFIPLLYIISPPPNPERRRLMAQKGTSGLWRPRQEAKEERWSPGIWISEAPHLMMTGWSIWANWVSAGL
jgi:hypothetical protein